MSNQPAITSIAYSEALVDLLANKESLTLTAIAANLVLLGQVNYSNGDTGQFRVNGYVVTGSEDYINADFHEGVEIAMFHSDNSIKFTNLDIDNIEKMVQEYVLRNDSPIKDIALDIFANDTIDLYTTSPIARIIVTYPNEKTIVGRGLDFLKRLVTK